MRLFETLCLVALSTLGLIAAQSNASSHADPDRVRTFDYHREIFFAVLEGLYVDGVPNEAVDILLAVEDGQPAHFVQGCPICMPAIDALSVYRSRPPFWNKAHTDTFGPGLSADQLDGLKSPDPERRLKVVTALVERWVERRLAAQRPTETERAAWQQALEDRRKKGMAILAGSRQRARERGEPGPLLDLQRCAFCDGANDGAR